MATAKIYFDVRRPLKSGLYPIRIRVIHELKSKFYATAFSMSRNEFDKISGGVYLDKEQKKIYNALKTLEKKAIDIISDLESFSFEVFEKKFFNTGDKSDLLYLLTEKANDFKANEKFGSSNLYLQAAALLKKFHNGDKLPLKLLSPDFLRRFQSWALKEGYSVTTIGMYLVRVKAIVNASEINKDNNPFGKPEKGKYQIPKSNNSKRPLTQVEIMLLYGYETDNRTEIFARDMFMFSYLANGMNMYDIFKLRWSSIKGSEFSFVRQKTSAKQPDKKITVLINEDIQVIINRHGQHKINKDGYVFNVLHGCSDAESEHKKIRATISVINSTLKRIAGAIGINTEISTYYARHSFATILRDADVPLSYISAQLGHADLHTTQSYLDKYKTEKVAEFQSKLLKKA